ncbi:HV333 protein, partial [Polypterus senegalus]
MKILQPRSVSRTPQKICRIECAVIGVPAVGDGVHWYRETHSQHLHWIAYFIDDTLQSTLDPLSDRFFVVRASEMNTFVLTITDARAEDSGVYYCAARGGHAVFNSPTCRS